MIILRLKGEKVVSWFHADAAYQPNENEVKVEALPEVVLKSDERGFLYYRDGQVVVEIEKR